MIKQEKSFGKNQQPKEEQRPTENFYKNELLTQAEVADYFRVALSTIKNWREKGYLTYFQVPSSSRILYYRDSVIQLRDDNTVNRKGGGSERKARPTKEKPDISATQKEWRI